MSASSARRWLLGVLLGSAIALAVVYARNLCQGYEALLTLLDLVHQPPAAAIDIRPVALRTPLTFAVEERHYRADLYRTADPVLAGIVFVPGAAAEGKEDARAIHFATTLARARFAVLVPDIVALRELKLLPESRRDVADAVTYLRSRKELTPAGRAGILTTSVAVGPALLALLDSSLSRRVRFLVSVGGYFDLPRILTYFTTGHYDAYGLSLRNKPHEYGKWVYALSNASRLENARERYLLGKLARRKLENPEAEVNDLLASLSTEARQVYDFIVNRDPARSARLLSRFPPALRRDLEQLNLAVHDLSGIETRFIFVHGLDDSMIPYSESVALAAALPAGQSQIFLPRGLVHVDVAPDAMDGVRMWSAIYALLSERYL
ncbi:MAG: alpha/beta hydrolase [Pseudomonadota bacterium]|nr:alpha/beta hydrolase [Pseudomonadota bacterium]